MSNHNGQGLVVFWQFKLVAQIKHWLSEDERMQPVVSLQLCKPLYHALLSKSRDICITALHLTAQDESIQQLKVLARWMYPHLFRHLNSWTITRENSGIGQFHKNPGLDLMRWFYYTSKSKKQKKSCLAFILKFVVYCHVTTVITWALGGNWHGYWVKCLNVPFNWEDTE